MLFRRVGVNHDAAAAAPSAIAHFAWRVQLSHPSAITRFSHIQATADALATLTSAAELDVSALEAAEMSVNAAIGAFMQYRRDHSHQCRRRLATPTTNAIVMLVTLSFSPLGA